jgi:TRAP-type C4-dicarboxylate transport system permease small subunit
MLSFLIKLNTKIIRTAEILIKIQFSIMAIIVFFDVVSRYVFSSPLSWSEEMARYLLIWISCLGAGIIMGEHIRIELILNYVPDSAKRWLLLISDILALFFLVLLVVEGIPRAIVLKGTTSPSVPGITMFWVYLAIPTFALIGITHGLKNLIASFTGKG